MIIQQAAGRLWVFSDGRSGHPRLALAGPFRDRELAAWWIVERMEHDLTEPQREQWGRAMTRAGGLDANPFQLIGLLLLIRQGMADALIGVSSPMARHPITGLPWRKEICPEYPTDDPRTANAIA